MAISKFDHKDVGKVTIVRRRGLKYVSIRVDHSGAVKLNLPWYVPKTTGLLFITKKQDWIKQQLVKKVIKTDDYEIAGIKIIVQATEQKKSSILENSNSVILKIPKSYSLDRKKTAIDKLVSNYLKTKTEEIIVPQANILANRYGYKPKSITVKKLKSRWGSCDHGGRIKLSLYLYSLPDELWQYVLCHELAHLHELNHSPKFWKIVEQMYPEYKKAKKLLKNHSPTIYLP